MLQCNRYPGLDANEIIRLTSAIGHQETFARKIYRAAKDWEETFRFRRSPAVSNP